MSKVLTFSRVFKRVICFFVDHKVKSFDGPYQVCDRCKSHQYYDLNFHFVLRELIRDCKWRLYWWYRYKVHDKCADCKKSLHIFGKTINDHSDCLPF